jgi:regulator of sigma E protease
MDALSTGALFFAVLSVLVFIHELGHYLMARIIGVEVEEFGLGLPPRAWGKKIGKTIYSLNWLPIGGFVRLKGEDETEDEHGKVAKKDLSKYFWARSKKERSLILIAGVTMNFLLAVVVTAYLLVTGVKEPTGVVRVTTVSEKSPASDAGIVDNFLASV